MASPDVSFLLGYGSYCTMNLRVGDNEGALKGGATGGTGVPLLSANYDRTLSVPMQGSYNTPLNSANGGRFRIGVGTYQFSGSLSFELTSEISNLVFGDGFFKRRSFLDIELGDGEGEISVPGAVWNSFSVNANPNAVINCQIAFLSCNGYQYDIEVRNASPGSEEKFPDIEPYWRYGEEGVQSFVLSFSRNVTPCYLNESSWTGPTYLRVGLMEVSFEITCWEKWFEHNSLKLGDKTLRFTSSSFISQKSYQFAGMSGEGMKTYTNTAAGIGGSSELFTID